MTNGEEDLPRSAKLKFLWASAQWMLHDVSKCRPSNPAARSYRQQGCSGCWFIFELAHVLLLIWFILLQNVRSGWVDVWFLKVLGLESVPLLEDVQCHEGWAIIFAYIVYTCIMYIAANKHITYWYPGKWAFWRYIFHDRCFVYQKGVHVIWWLWISQLSQLLSCLGSEK